MALMEFLDPNLANTTTQFTVSSGTGTVQYLFDRNTKLPYTTAGYNTSTSTILSIQFGTPTVVSHIMLQGHNLRQYRAFYNSVTANTFTPDINVTTGSVSATYFSFNSITVNSVQIQMDTVIGGNADKSVGEFVLSERRLVFERNPSQPDWSPVSRRKQVVHEMPDGGVSVYNIRDKYRTVLRWQFITSSFRNSLFTLWDEACALYFVPFPTTGSDWDGAAHEVIWIGQFDFKHSDNAKAAGYGGSIELRETAGG